MKNKSNTDLKNKTNEKENTKKSKKNQYETLVSEKEKEKSNHLPFLYF